MWYVMVRRTLRLLAVGVADELRRLLHKAGFNLPPVYLRLVAPMNDPKALALLPLKVRGRACGVCALHGEWMGLTMEAAENFKMDTASMRSSQRPWHCCHSNRIVCHALLGAGSVQQAC